MTNDINRPGSPKGEFEVFPATERLDGPPQKMGEPSQGANSWVELLASLRDGRTVALEEVIVVVHPPPANFFEMNDLMLAIMAEGAKWGIPSVFLSDDDPDLDELFRPLAATFAPNQFGRFTPSFIAGAAIFMGGHFQACLDSAIRCSANAAFKRGERSFKARLFPDTIYTLSPGGEPITLSGRLKQISPQNRLAFLRGELERASIGSVPLLSQASVHVVHAGESALVQPGNPELTLAIHVEGDAKAEQSRQKNRRGRPALVSSLFSSSVARVRGGLRPLVR
ncbi:MAG: hypothetical protein Q7T11_08255 [Deltaproteobacteria bacterium]|nr:hypothetical protein [Deltaproteobacteria bacterium]